MTGEVDAMFFLKYNLLSHIYLLRIEIDDIKTGTHVNRDFRLKLSDKKLVIERF